MNFQISLDVFGYRIATINLQDLSTPGVRDEPKLLDKLAKNISNGFFRRMIK